ncbi:MAG TPA: outer membrane beta-barrel protein [Alphaproteobacteria bacterium]|nr:outer membrane beta-barrel protein [Alphaproteobacteria bacterium]
MISGKKILCAAAALAAFIAFHQEAAAQVSRLYMAGYMGLNVYKDQDFEATSPAVTKGTMNLDNAPSFAGAIGLRLSRDFRVEAELSYRKADVNQLDFPGAGGGSGGELQQYMGFLNLYYDFDIPGKIKPFIGGGLGMGLFSGEANNSAGGPSFANEDTTALMWNAGGGVKYRVKDDTAFSVGYRYLDSTDLSFDDFDIDYSSHEFRIGIEYDF